MVKHPRVKHPSQKALDVEWQQVGLQNIRRLQVMLRKLLWRCPDIACHGSYQGELKRSGVLQHRDEHGNNSDHGYNSELLGWCGSDEVSAATGGVRCQWCSIAQQHEIQ